LLEHLELVEREGERRATAYELGAKVHELRAQHQKAVFDLGDQPEVDRSLAKRGIVDQRPKRFSELFSSEKLWVLVAPARNDCGFDSEQLVEALALLPNAKELRDARQRKPTLLQALDHAQAVGVHVRVVADPAHDPGRGQEALSLVEAQGAGRRSGAVRQLV